MFELTAEALIHAPPETVYDLLVDLERYAEWNPWIFEASGGPAAEGRRVEMSVRLGRRTMAVRHEVLESRPGRRLVWRDLGWFTPFASGVRARELRAEAAGTRYQVVLRISGPLAWLVRWWLGADLDAGLWRETEALTRAAEARRRAIETA